MSTASIPPPADTAQAVRHVRIPAIGELRCKVLEGFGLRFFSGQQCGAALSPCGSAGDQSLVDCVGLALDGGAGPGGDEALIDAHRFVVERNRPKILALRWTTSMLTRAHTSRRGSRWPLGDGSRS